MLKRKPVPEIKLLKELVTPANGACNGALLVSVENGMGALRTAQLETPGTKSNFHASLAVTLNGTPLVFTRTPRCGTCESFLAAGYGIEHTDCEELCAVSRNLNKGFKDITEAFDSLKPILGLLDSGVYVVADIPHFPTDGSGRFFWDVSDEMTSYPATAAVMTEDSQCIPGVPAFLYPSQTAASFDAARMRHYMDRYKQYGDRPRAVAYHLSEYLSVLLDGHHKAAAAAQLKQSVHCLTIIAPTSVVYEPSYTRKHRIVTEVNFAGIRVAADHIPKCALTTLSSSWAQYPVSKLQAPPISRPVFAWDKSFSVASHHYPTVEEYGESIALDIREITEDLIAECLSSPTEHAAKLRHIVLALSRVRDSRMKHIALICANHPDFSVAAAAFRALVKIKDDPQIEDFFVNYLTDHTDTNSLLKSIADSYWTE